MLCLLLAARVAWAPVASAQTATGEISGLITDSTGSRIPLAKVTAVNEETGVERTTQTSTEGRYVVPVLMPGTYRVTVAKSGFQLVTISDIKLDVNQTVTQDIALSLGTVAEYTEVSAAAELLQQSSAELGTVIEQKAIHDLPLNGRNFTQLLTLTPGATPVSTAQSAGVGMNGQEPLGVPTASVAQPSIQGQFNRSNLYLLDGAINTDLTSSVYVIPPIVDAMEEFKVQSHNDKAEYGGVLGGVVNVVTRGGGNQLHGSAWEFLRNNALDARDPFQDEFRSSPAPFRQNQFGALISGPVLIPKLYDGRNHTFFLFAYEGWRYRQASETLYRVPTDEELAGDFSNSIVQRNIYDPSTTRPDPNNPAGFIRAQFPGNVMPASRIDSTMLSFIKTYYSRPNLTGDPVYNAIVTRSGLDDSDHYDARIDEQLGDNTLFFRYSRLNVTDLSPISASEDTGASVAAKDIGAGWHHMFSSSLMLENRFGYANRPYSRFQPNTAGIDPMLKLGFSSPGGSTISLASPWVRIPMM